MNAPVKWRPIATTTALVRTDLSGSGEAMRPRLLFVKVFDVA